MAAPPARRTGETQLGRWCSNATRGMVAQLGTTEGPRRGDAFDQIERHTIEVAAPQRPLFCLQGMRIASTGVKRQLEFDNSGSGLRHHGAGYSISSGSCQDLLEKCSVTPPRGQ